MNFLLTYTKKGQPPFNHYNAHFLKRYNLRRQKFEIYKSANFCVTSEIVYLLSVKVVFILLLFDVLDSSSHWLENI